MNQTLSAARYIARQLLTYEAEQSNLSDTDASSTLLTFEKIRQYMEKLVGVAGFHALLARALVLAKNEVTWLGAVHVRADGSLEGFGEASKQLKPDEIERGGVTLLAQLLALLITFIGEALTLHLVGAVWSHVSLKEFNLSLEETLQ